ncbi:FkbM family methyltransferase [Halomicrococcus gelatinilyticus]|uniref:FkbM family methyltransferase n=1 Tax=Halomicrococcus gelatinilyticus TaxID=1702103 RepID=UPI002E0E27BC
MADLAQRASESRLWEACKRAGLASHISSLYWRSKLAANCWSASVTVGGHTVTFATDTPTEYQRATSLVGERAVVESLLADVRPSDVVYDVGANIGTHACFVGRQLRDGEVVAFEPMPTNAVRLRHNLSTNVPSGRWRVAELALDDDDGTGRLSVESDDFGEGNHALATDGDLPVDVRRGESLIDEGTYPAPDVLKVDVEGAELRVLRGLADRLDDVRVVYVELHHELSSDYDTSTAEIEAFLCDHGFSTERLNERSDAYHVRASRV